MRHDRLPGGLLSQTAETAPRAIPKQAEPFLAILALCVEALAGYGCADEVRKIVNNALTKSPPT